MRNGKLKIKTLTAVIMILFLCVSTICSVQAKQAQAAQSSLSALNDEMDDYIAKTRKSIKANWYPPSKDFEHSATLVLTINKEGQLENCGIANPSPSEKFNDSLINAAKKTTYSPLPNRYKGKTLDIPLEFNMQKRTISK